MPQRIVPCLECPVRFYTEADLRAHLLLTHPIVPPSAKRRLTQCNLGPRGIPLGWSAA